jgi:hypothetical protein
VHASGSSSGRVRSDPPRRVADCRTTVARRRTPADTSSWRLQLFALEARSSDPDSHRAVVAETRVRRRPGLKPGPMFSPGRADLRGERGAC